MEDMGVYGYTLFRTIPDNLVRCGERGRAFCIPLALLDRVHPQTEDGVSVPLFAHALLGF